MEAFGNAAVVGIQAGLQKTYIDALKTTIIPSYERTTEELFRQIQSIFLQGTKSCKLKHARGQIRIIITFLPPDTKQFDAYMSQYQPMQEETTSLLLAVPDQLKSSSEATIATCTNRIQSEITKDLKALQVNLVKSLRDSVKKEVRGLIEWWKCNKFS